MLHKSGNLKQDLVPLTGNFMKLKDIYIFQLFNNVQCGIVAYILQMRFTLNKNTGILWYFCYIAQHFEPYQNHVI